MAICYESYQKRSNLQADIEDRERILNRIDRMEASGIIDSGSHARSKLQSLDNFSRRLAEDKKRLAETTPPDLKQLNEKGISREKLVARSSQLRDFIVNSYAGMPRMLSKEEMDACPAGAVDMNRLFHKKILNHNVAPDGTVFKCGADQMPAAFEWKNLQRVLHKEGEEDLDNSIANLETLRPARVNPKDSLPEANYGRIYASPAANLSAEEYERIFGTEHLSAIQKYVLQQEKQGTLRAPTLEEHYQRMFQPATPAEPVHLGFGRWKLPSGEVLHGVNKEQAFEHWQKEG